jgi:peptidoglycan/LPS O-acetylase OafA/YrhL
MLDGLRGCAALLVAIMHGEAILGAKAFDHAYLMVDLFFLISGFVLSAGYGDRLSEGGRGLWFLRARATRLYPLAFVGLLLGLGVSAVLGARDHTGAERHGALMFGLAAAFVPWLGGGLLVPLNGPIWSLQVELWANLVYGYVARWLSESRLAAIVAMAALGLAFVGCSNGRIDGGFANNDPVHYAGPWSFLIGWLRIAFSFPLGILLHRTWRRRATKASPGNMPQLVIATLIAISLCSPVPWPALDLAIVCLVFPVLLFATVSAAPGPGPGPVTARLCAVMGRMSFGLYAIHAPVFVLAQALRPANASLFERALIFVAALVLSILLAMAAERWIDLPARRWAKAWSGHGASGRSPIATGATRTSQP